MKNVQKTFAVLALAIIIFSCSKDDGFLTPASLKVVHAIEGAPNVYLKNFASPNFGFVVMPTLGYSQFKRLTLLDNKTQSIGVTFATDTTTQVFTEEFDLKAGEIATCFLVGNENNVSSVFFMDEGLTSLQDSVNAIRFINLSTDVNALTIDYDGATTNLISDMTLNSASDFIKVDATLSNLSYLFRFNDDQGNVVASYTHQQWLVYPWATYKRSFQENITLALVGALDDGQGNNTLSVIKIDH